MNLLLKGTLLDTEEESPNLDHFVYKSRLPTNTAVP